MKAEAHITEIHLVDDFQAALGVAEYLESEAVAFDMEGVLGNYVGNNRYPNRYPDFMHGDGYVNMRHASGFIKDHSEVAFGIATNNTNLPNCETGQDGLVTCVADALDILALHKGLSVGGTVLRAKPSGDQTSVFCEIVEVSPRRTVLIDDQGIKNAGEAVRADLKAIIVPHPIGLPREEGDGVIEHVWVQRARTLEPSIYASLKHHGPLARLAFRRLGKVEDPSRLRLHDWRT
jgi:hypothetical protein